MFLPDFNDKYVLVFNCTCISLYARLNLVLLFWYFLIGFRNKLYTVTKLLLHNNTSGTCVYKSAKSFCNPNTFLTVFCIHLTKQTTTKMKKEKQQYFEFFSLLHSMYVIHVSISTLSVVVVFHLYNTLFSLLSLSTHNSFGVF